MPHDLSADYDAMLEYYGRRMREAGFRVDDADNLQDRYNAMADLACARAERDAFINMSHEHAQRFYPPQSPYPVGDDGVALTPEVAMKAAGLNSSDPQDVAVYQAGQQKLAFMKSKGFYRE